MTRYRIHPISEPVSAYEFEDARTLEELSDAVVRDGYCTFEEFSARLGGATEGAARQTVFAANIARIAKK